jgi:mRNA-degrading endonuclease RelE of RelBE toxin-antitoxin system
MITNERPEFQIRLRSKRVQRELDKLQEGDYRRVLVKLKALAYNSKPQESRKLSDGIYRIRVGDIRIIYFIDEDNKRIEIGGILRRGKSTYKGIDELFRDFNQE